MPGPGGGANGGGFGGGSRGGGFGGGGGGFGGGGFGGGPHRPHRPHGFHTPFFFFPRYRYYHGGGCLGGFIGALILPIVFVLVFAMALIIPFTTAVSNIVNGGSVRYDERVMQTYGNEQYAAAFGDETSTYEENILIVFLVNEERDGYYVYACVGDDLATDVKALYGNDRTPFGATVLSTVNSEYYEYSLSSNLADVMNKMASETKNAGAVGTEGKNTSRSRLYNKSSLAMNESTVTSALFAFTEQTGISASIVVEDMEEVFGKKIQVGDIMIVVLMLLIVALTVFLIVRAIRAKKNGGGGGSGEYTYEDGTWKKK
ncbi:MAG: hypothetical protein IKA64_06935 [Clostridia bacterium]|nr:hypothetical protein [Clostridia bacterium]